ncbi:MAG: hypothetical protein ACI4RU_04040, partial [Acutalibacteraceae bacterium]
MLPKKPDIQFPPMQQVKKVSIDFTCWQEIAAQISMIITPIKHEKSEINSLSINVKEIEADSLLIFPKIASKIKSAIKDDNKYAIPVPSPAKTSIRVLLLSFFLPAGG